METNDKFICLPPYLSTSWRNVRSLHMKSDNLVVTLLDGSLVEIPRLGQNAIEHLFACHAAFLRQQRQRPFSEVLRTNDGVKFGRPGEEETGLFPPFRLGLSGLDTLGTALQHNYAQSNTPDLPPEILQKIAAVARIVAPDDVNALPKAEPHCNCVHCQIARAIHQGLEQGQEIAPQEPEEEVTAEDLTFRQWIIEKTGENLYSVMNPLDETQHYSVYLGHPVGCTCGNQNCEHILAVLRS